MTSDKKFVDHMWIYPSVLEARDYQLAAAKTALGGNTMCVLPTGMGKTPVAILVSAERLRHNMHSKILMLAPTKPLASQHRRTFQKFLRIGESELKVVTGEIKPAERIKQYSHADVVFSTPQTIKNDLEAGRLSLANYSLLIVDECHRAVKKYAYTYIAKAYMLQAHEPLILGLTASPGGHKYRIDDVRKKLFIKNVEIRTRMDEDVKDYMQKVEENKIDVALTDEMMEIRTLLEEMKHQSLDVLIKWNVIHRPDVTKRELLELQERLQKASGGFKYMALSKIAEIIKIDHAITLLETQTLHSTYEYLQSLKTEGENGETRATMRLIKQPEFTTAMERVEKLISEGKEHPKLAKLREIVSAQLISNADSRIIVFAQYRDTLAKLTKELDIIEGAKPVLFIGQAIKKGSGMKQDAQLRVLNEFKLGIHNVLCASSIGEEGIDVTETNLVVFYEPVPSEIRSIQRRGRTGRTQEGRVVILVTKGTRDEAYYWSAYHKEQKMHKTLDGMQHQRDLGTFNQSADD